MKRSELLEDYCQRCGATLGSIDCCQHHINATITQQDIIDRIVQLYALDAWRALTLSESLELRKLEELLDD